jgi:hypothetical protein
MRGVLLAGFAGAVLSFALAGSAWAADAAPKGEWIVGPIQADSPAGSRFCSMKNIYEGGVALVLARDASGGNSIAIDFSRDSSRPALETGKQYLSVFSVGDAGREVPALAAAERVLVVQMGNDEIFYDMLARKGLLTARLAGMDFSFGLRGTSKALIALDNCAAAFNGGRKNHAKTALPPVFSDTDGFDPPLLSTVSSAPVIKVHHPGEDRPGIADVSDSSSDLSLELKRLKAQNEALELEHAAALAKLRAAELEKMQADRRREAAFAERGQALRTGNERLQSELAAARAESRDAGDVERRLRELEAENRRLQDEKAAAQIHPGMAPPALAEAGFVEALLASRPDLAWSGNAYTWEGGGITGSAETYPAVGKDLHLFAQEYIAATGKNCPGDFAFKLADAVKPGKASVAQAELACIDGVNDAAAAVLFVSEPDRIVVVSHEGPAARMPEALDARDKVIALVR